MDIDKGFYKEFIQLTQHISVSWKIKKVMIAMETCAWRNLVVPLKWIPTQHTSSQWHFQRQQHLISIIININIIQSQWHYQYHLILMTLSTATSSSHINIIINNNIISYQLLSISSLIITLYSINIIININDTSYQLISLITVSSINHIPHIHTYIVHA